MSCRITELRHKPVINICDGQRFGCVDDMLIDEDSGRIAALIVPGVYKLFGCLRPADDYIIDWCRVRKVSSELILVELKEPPRHAQRPGRLFFR